MSPRQEIELLDACRILFPGAEINRQFLCYIQPEGLKNAYRNRAWECHPDACDANGSRPDRTELFRRSVEAYKLLDSFLKERKNLPLRYAKPTNKSSFPRTVVAAKRAENEQYYSGPMPTIELKLGLFLYYSGVVSYQAVVRALIWQRNLRPPIGDFARQWGWLTEKDVSLILAATEIVGSFVERALAMGLLTQSQLNLILLHQRSRQQPIGSYFVEQNLLTELTLRHHLRELDRHNKQVRDSRPK
jgi:hypothetical protein